MIDFLLRHFRRNFGKDKMFYRAIDDMFGFLPHNIELYKLALIHKSASITLDNGQHINNERLEFLGDAVIETVTSDYLFIEFPDKNEGFLTQMRSKMVSRQSLNAVAKRLGLDQHVITNSTNNSSQKHIYGDAFEAMMGAIYLDQGYDFANRLLINKIFANFLKLDTLVEAETDFKSRLIEWCQKNHHTIHFTTTFDKNYSTSHPFFYSKVLIDNIEVGYGAGESKKEAEQRAAYSVSQGFNDADCNKLMDRLDNIEGENKSKEDAPSGEPKQTKESKPRRTPKRKSVEVKETVNEEISNEPTVVESANTPKEDIAEEAAKESKPKRSHARRSSKPKADSTSAENTTTEDAPISASTIGSVSSTEQADKPKSRTRRRRTPKDKTATPDNTTSTTSAE